MSLIKRFKEPSVETKESSQQQVTVIREQDPQGFYARFPQSEDSSAQHSSLISGIGLLMRMKQNEDENSIQFIIELEPKGMNKEAKEALISQLTKDSFTPLHKVNENSNSVFLGVGNCRFTADRAQSILNQLADSAVIHFLRQEGYLTDTSMKARDRYMLAIRDPQSDKQLVSDLSEITQSERYKASTNKKNTYVDVPSDGQGDFTIMFPQTSHEENEVHKSHRVGQVWVLRRDDVTRIAFMPPEGVNNRGLESLLSQDCMLGYLDNVIDPNQLPDLLKNVIRSRLQPNDVQHMRTSMPGMTRLGILDKDSYAQESALARYYPVVVEIKDDDADLTKTRAALVKEGYLTSASAKALNAVMDLTHQLYPDVQQLKSALPSILAGEDYVTRTYGELKNTEPQKKGFLGRMQNLAQTARSSKQGIHIYERQGEPDSTHVAFPQAAEPHLSLSRHISDILVYKGAVRGNDEQKLRLALKVANADMQQGIMDALSEYEGLKVALVDMREVRDPAITRQGRRQAHLREQDGEKGNVFTPTLHTRYDRALPIAIEIDGDDATLARVTACLKKMGYITNTSEEAIQTAVAAIIHDDPVRYKKLHQDLQGILNLKKSEREK